MNEIGRVQEEQKEQKEQNGIRGRMQDRGFKE